MAEVDAIVVGSGPNGLAAAVTLARAGLAVRVYERDDDIGGGSATRELTLPGFHHDVCSAVHPLALASEFFRRFGLTERIPFVTPEISFGHPLGAGAGIAYHDIARTAEGLGRDGPAWLKLLGPLVARVNSVDELTGGSLLRMPRHPFDALAFGFRALEQGTRLWNLRFTEDTAPALLTGVFAHTSQGLPSVAAAGAGLALASYAHTVGWPIPVGGSGAIVRALVDDLVAHGGEIVTGSEIRRLSELPPAEVVLLDVTPRGLLTLANGTLPHSYARSLRRFRYGNGVAKLDFALAEPVPWRAAELRHAPTVHVGGTRAELARAESTVARGRHAEHPYILVSQPGLIDATRAPVGKHVLWAYTHVPHGSDLDQAETVIGELERYAPGFRDTILAVSSRTARDLEEHNPNYVGGDIAAGAVSWRQLVRRPIISSNPWRTPLPGVYLCSASTPPGPGVHGLGGWHAARQALREHYGITEPPGLSPQVPAS